MIYELAKQDERIVFIGSDLGAGVLDEFKRDMPDRFFMEGVGEANMVGMAAGLALSGKIVYCNTIATFLTRRAFEQVAIDVGLHRANVRLIGNGGGAVYAPLGPTHIATDDIALMRTIPGMTILAPCDAVDMEQLMRETAGHRGPLYIRLGKGGDPKLQWCYRRVEESDVMFIGTGTASQIAFEAADSVGGDFLHLPRLKPLTIRNIPHHHQSLIVTVEDHSVVGGLGSAVAECLMETGYPGRLIRIGYPDVWPHGYGTQDELRARYGIDVDSIVKRIQKELHGSAR